MKHIHNYLLSVSETKFELNRVVGYFEGYLINDSSKSYQLCDAIVESGSTLKENNLEIFHIVLDYGSIKICLYMKN